MKVEQELEEALKKMVKIRQKLSQTTNSLEEQAAILEKSIEAATSDSQDKTEQTQRIAELCLLAELSGSLGFDEMIEARAKFKEMMPEYFEAYLKHLEASSWEITWSGCLDCAHFSGQCNLGLNPKDKETDTYRLEKTCSSWEKKSRKL